MAEPGKAARFWGPLLVIFLPAVIGEAVFLALLASQPGGGDATAELVVGGAVAGALALVSSLIFLRAGSTRCCMRSQPLRSSTHCGSPTRSSDASWPVRP